MTVSLTGGRGHVEPEALPHADKGQECGQRAHPQAPQGQRWSSPGAARRWAGKSIQKGPAGLTAALELKDLVAWGLAYGEGSEGVWKTDWRPFITCPLGAWMFLPLYENRRYGIQQYPSLAKTSAQSMLWSLLKSYTIFIDCYMGRKKGNTECFLAGRN